MNRNDHYQYDSGPALTPDLVQFRVMVLNQSYQAGDLRTVRKNSMLWPIHSCAPVRRNSSSTFWRDSTVPVVFSSSGMRFRSRSSGIVVQVAREHDGSGVLQAHQQ